ncbi:MAG: tetratricopeptide repeat protein [Candidatus Omnitrophica bacterium]|nr:tetratricopeptide repeat protein [Candidatus Omnitrophota bacterium]
MTKIIKSLIVAGVLFFVAQFSKDAISGIADDTETGPHREWADKAHIAATSGKFDEAISCADKAIQIKPDYAAAFNTRGYAHNQKKLYDEAIKDFDMVVKIKPNYFAAYINRGSAKYYKGQYDSCIVDQSMAIKLDPSYSIAYLIRARAYVKKGADDLAIDDYNRVLELDPKDAAAYSERADIYRKKGENGLALEDMKKAILHDPKNENFKKNLAKLEQSSVSDVPVASDFSAPGGLPSSAAESTPQPAPSSSSGAESSESVRVLAPFSGYAVGDQCNQCDSSQSGVPWQPGQPEISGTVGAPELGQYEALLRHTMQGLRLLYGNLSATEESTFNAFWAPFFDHPTKPALEYFKKITPLLDETEVTLNNLDGTLSGLGQSLEGVFLAGGDSSNPANQIASIKYQDVKALRARLADLTKQIEALGNPPNPLAAKCAARKRHRKAIGGKDVWEFLHQAKIVGLKIDKNTVGGNITYFESVDKPEVELKWNGTKFTYNSINPHFENPCQPWTAGDAGQPQWGGYTYSFQGSGEMSADGLTVLSFHGVRVRRCCESPGSPSEQVVEQVRNFDYERPGLVLYQGKPVTIEDGRVRLVYSNIENPDLSGKKFIENSLVLEFRSYLDFEELNWGAIATNLSNLVKAAGGEGSSAQIESTTSQGGIPVGAPDAGAPGGNKKSSDPEQDPKVINEAIADHMALSEQARRDGERWAADAGKETNDDRRKDLERRAANFFANAQAEKYIADSLRTGTIVHTRTAWD